MALSLALAFALSLAISLALVFALISLQPTGWDAGRYVQVRLGSVNYVRPPVSKILAEMFAHPRIFFFSDRPGAFTALKR